MQNVNTVFSQGYDINLRRTRKKKIYIRLYKSKFIKIYNNHRNISKKE